MAGRRHPGNRKTATATCAIAGYHVYFSDFAAIECPASCDGHAVKPAEGFSIRPIFMNQLHGRHIPFWEHEGNRAVRKGKWKLVCNYPGDWELYDMDADRTELNDVSGDHPDVAHKLKGLYDG